VLRAQLALTRLKEHLIELEQERDSARAQLAALLGRSLDESVEIAGSYQASDTTPPIEELERIAIEHRPELAALRREVIKQQDTSELTRMASRPDLTLAGGYMLMPSGSMYRKAYMAELSMNLPALNRFRHEQEAKQSDAATDVMQAELEARTTAVFLEIKQAQIQLRSAQSRAKLYHDTLLPQAQATFQASSEAYENNRAEFTSLIESQNLLLEIRTAYFQSLAAADAATAELEHAIGAPVPGKTSAINQESHP
jgi:cobalt-zinc-cadmium efflux system outer membrane protein